MTLFEYLSVAVSIVLSLGVAHVLGSLRALFGPRRDALLTLWAALLLIAHALLWWTLWSYRDAAWDFGRFLLALAGPALLYAAATTLVPASAAADHDWRAHFEASRRWLFSLLLLLLLQISTLFWLLGGLVLLAGALAPRRRTQIAIVVVVALLLVALSFDQLSPGAATYRPQRAATKPLAP
jgi:hypothetical protein